MRIELPTDKISSRERYLEAIVQSAIDYAIISLDLDGIVTSWNEGARLILGWSADEMIGKPARLSSLKKTGKRAFPSWR